MKYNIIKIVGGLLFVISYYKILQIVNDYFNNKVIFILIMSICYLLGRFLITRLHLGETALFFLTFVIMLPILKSFGII